MSLYTFCSFRSQVTQQPNNYLPFSCSNLISLGVKRTQEWLASWGRNEDDPIFDWDINIFKAPVPNFPSLQIPSELMNQIQILIDQDLYEQVAHLHDQYVAAVRADIDTMWRKYNGWKVEIEDMYDVSKILDKLVPDDYDPPRYTDIKGKIIYLDDEGERFERYSKVRENSRVCLHIQTYFIVFHPTPSYIYSRPGYDRSL